MHLCALHHNPKSIPRIDIRSEMCVNLMAWAMSMHLSFSDFGVGQGLLPCSTSATAICKVYHLVYYVVRAKTMTCALENHQCSALFWTFLPSIRSLIWEGNVSNSYCLIIWVLICKYSSITNFIDTKTLIEFWLW